MSNTISTTVYDDLYAVKFTTTSDVFKEKLQPFNGRIKEVSAKDETQAVERAYKKLLTEFPDSTKDTWEVKKVIKVGDNIFNL